MITGGWDFVWAAYGVTWAALLLYGLSLFVRRREVAALEGEGEHDEKKGDA